MACNTGDACGFTETRSPDCSCSNHSEVMMETIDAHDAWCPPTFMPPGLGRTRLAWWTIEVDNQSTAREMSSSATPSGSAGAADGACARLMCAPDEMKGLGRLCPTTVAG